MKSLIYKNPLISGITINTIALIIYLYSIVNSVIWVMPLMVLVGIANRRIIDNGQGINRKKKAIILISFFLMLITILTYNSYIHNLRDIEIGS